MPDLNNAPQQKNKSGALMAAMVIGALLLVGLITALVVTRDDDSSSTNTTSNNTQQTDQDESDDEPIEILISEEGFDPETFIIDVGDTVRWTNDGNSPHHIASDPYPEATDLPGLNSGEEPLGPGAYYEYTFTEPGTYGFHDQLDPLVNGEIIVE